MKSRRPSRFRLRGRLCCCGVALVTLMAGCAATPPAAAPTTAAATDAGDAGNVAPTPTPTDIDPALLGPLTALGPCTVEPNVLDEEPAEGTLLPDGAVLTSQTVEGPLTTIKGYIPMTPIQIRVFYQRQDDYDYEILQVEDEIRESEILLADGDNRLFVKAQAICELGSVFLAVLAPEGAGDQVPAPAGGGGG